MAKNTSNTSSNGTNNTTKRTTSDKKETFLQALKLNLGNISQSCKASNIGRQTYYDWVNDDEEFKHSCKDVEESLLDLAENRLLEKIDNSDITAIIFFLKTKGKKRGYIEKQEVELIKPIDDIEFDGL